MSDPQPEPIEEPLQVPEPAEEPEPEREEGDADSETETETETVVEQQNRSVTPEEIEKRAKASYKSFESYAKRVFGIFEDESHDLVECPLCPTQHKGFLNINDAGRVPQDIKDSVMQFLGFAREVDYPHSPQHRTCPDCQGLGRVATGSQVPGQENIGCGSCHERGWLGPLEPHTNGKAEVTPGMTGPLHTPPPVSTEEVDEWQEPRVLPDGRLNPNFGKSPKWKVPVEPWGITAGLTAQDAVTA